MLEDPHEAGQRVELFRKTQISEEYLAHFNNFLMDFDPGGTDDCSVGQRFPIIYVIGLPRSGTTFLSQLISRYLPVGYINNLIARFWMNPVVGIRLSQAILGSAVRKKITLKSTHGVTDEPWGPHEFGYFWRYWLRLDHASTHKLSEDMLQKVDREGLSSVLNSMTATFDAPLVFKNIICGLQAHFLSQVRPNSLFVLIERDLESVASSLLRCRKERYGDASVWWSLKPSTYAEISAIGSPESQIERQIVDSSREFNNELSKPGVISMRIAYDELCLDPVNSLQRIADTVTSLGCPLELFGTVASLKAPGKPIA